MESAPEDSEATDCRFKTEYDTKSFEKGDFVEAASAAGSLAGIDRRGVLRGIGVGTAAMAGLASKSVAVGRTQDAEASMTFEDQTLDGDSIVLAELTTPVDGVLIVQDKTDGKNTLFAKRQVSEGTHEDLVIELQEPIEESQTIQAWVYEGDPFKDDDAEVLEIAGAFVSLEGDADADVLGVTYVEADGEFGFDYPYYLFTPPAGDAEEVPLLVEPNNTGTSTDDFETHRERAKRLVGRGISRDVSEQLGVPLLVPVFPRPRSDPVGWKHYVHALDDTSLGIESGPLERVDLQLLRMATHAKEKVLSDSSYSLTDRIMLNGFSASGNFVDRFAVLHPERVLSVTAGGLNGMALLPLEEMDGHTLDYHVGIADLESLVGEAVDLDALDGVNQFLYMGENDDNDTIPYNDAWTDDDLRQTALEVYGDDMVTERFPRCQEAYEIAGVEAQFRVYEGEGHTPRPAADDVIEFHRRSMEGEDVGDFGQQLVATPNLEASSRTATVNEEIEFDAGDSSGGLGEITNYLWDFGDGETAVGESVPHAFGESGEYEVTMTIVLDNGSEKTVAERVEISAADGDPTAAESKDETTAESKDETTEGSSGGQTETAESKDETTEDSTDEQTANDADDDSTEGNVPGFGIVSALGGLGTVGYLLKRRVGDEEP